MAPILKTEDESATQLFVNLSGVVLRRKPTDENIFQDSISMETETENKTFVWRLAPHRSKVGWRFLLDKSVDRALGFVDTNLPDSNLSVG